MQQAKGGSVGHINIGIVTTAKYVLPRILGLFYRQFPQVKRVTLNIGNRAHVLGRLSTKKMIYICLVILLVAITSYLRGSLKTRCN